MKRLLAAAAVLFACVALFLLYQIAQNGRYQFSPSSRTIIDTRTGAVYEPDGTTGLSSPIIKPIE